MPTGYKACAGAVEAFVGGYRVFAWLSGFAYWTHVSYPTFYSTGSPLGIGIFFRGNDREQRDPIRYDIREAAKIGAGALPRRCSAVCRSRR